MDYFKPPTLRVHLFGYLFSPRWLITLVTLILFSFLVSLGIWQLHRAEQKRRLEKDFVSHSSLLHLTDIKNQQDPSLRFRPFSARGYFDNKHVIYLDNKMYRHSPGVHVITPFIIPEAQQMLLVNRGYLAVSNRSILPKTPIITGPVTLKGLLTFPSKSFLLKKEQWPENWPLMIESLDLNALSKKLGKPLFPFILLQQNPDGTPLIKEWHPVNFPSYRHTGYAIQWFSLALTLLVIYIKLNTSRVKEGQS